MQRNVYIEMKQTFEACAKCMLIIWPFGLFELYRPVLDYFAIKNTFMSYYFALNLIASI